MSIYIGTDEDGFVQVIMGHDTAMPMDGMGPPQLSPLGPYEYSEAPADAGAVIAARPTPSSCLRLVEGVLGWVETSTLDEAKARAWELAKQARDQAERAPFEFEGGMYDPNKENVSGAALAALIAQIQGVSVVRDWTLADNSVRALTGKQLIGLGIALSDRVDAVHAQGRALRALIEGATTPEQAYSYKWPTTESVQTGGE